jgi:hypothetical protein
VRAVTVRASRTKTRGARHPSARLRAPAVVSGEPGVIVSGDGGTAYKQGRASADTLVMTIDDCHEMQLVSLTPPYEVQRGELYLAFEGPRVRVIHVDATHAYLDTAHGLLRITHGELRRTLVPG